MTTAPVNSAPVSSASPSTTQPKRKRSSPQSSSAAASVAAETLQTTALNGQSKPAESAKVKTKETLYQKLTEVRGFEAKLDVTNRLALNHLLNRAETASLQTSRVEDYGRITKEAQEAIDACRKENELHKQEIGKWSLHRTKLLARWTHSARGIDRREQDLRQFFSQAQGLCVPSSLLSTLTSYLWTSPSNERPLSCSNSPTTSVSRGDDRKDSKSASPAESSKTEPAKSPNSFEKLLQQIDAMKASVEEVLMDMVDLKEEVFITNDVFDLYSNQAKMTNTQSQKRKLEEIQRKIDQLDIDKKIEEFEKGLDVHALSSSKNASAIELARIQLVAIKTKWDSLKHRRDNEIAPKLEGRKLPKIVEDKPQTVGSKQNGKVRESMELLTKIVKLKEKIKTDIDWLKIAGKEMRESYFATISTTVNEALGEIERVRRVRDKFVKGLETSITIRTQSIASTEMVIKDIEESMKRSRELLEQQKNWKIPEEAPISEDEKGDEKQKT